MPNVVVLSVLFRQLSMGGNSRLLFSPIGYFLFPMSSALPTVAVKTEFSVSVEEVPPPAVAVAINMSDMFLMVPRTVSM